MKLRDLLEALDLDPIELSGEVLSLDKELYISTEKQMLPNALYDFEVSESGGVIELNPYLKRG